MSTILIPRVRPTRLDPDQLREFAARLRVEGELIATDEAIAIVDRERTVVHGQPNNRMGGLTTAVDTSTGIAPPAEGERDVLDPDKAAAIVRELLDGAGLGVARTRTDLRLEATIGARITEGVHFDGKERRRFKAKTDVRARLTLDGIPISGPRSGVSATFTDDERPLRLLANSWDALEGYEEAELVDRDEVVGRLLEPTAARAERNGVRRPKTELISATLAYWAGEYCGGADVLQPCWFVEIATANGKDEAAPRQLVRVPATR